MSIAATKAPRAVAMPLLQGMRPRQWIKNALVLAVPLAAGRLFQGEILVPTALAFLAFCLGSSAVYLLNDICDVESDRLHPTKCHRPIASGALSTSSAATAAVLLAATSLTVALQASISLTGLVGVYLFVQLLYAISWKHKPVLDISVVASGFLTRGVAGGVAAGLPISQWFLLVAGFGSLFIVAGKRYSELRTLGAEAGTRRSLTAYSDSYLRFVWGVSAAATVMSYALWASNEASPSVVPWYGLSIAPFVMGMMRYGIDVDAGRAGEPEDIVYSDRTLQGIGLMWLLLLSVGSMSA